MKLKIVTLMFFMGLLTKSFSWTPDTTKLFWNRDFIIEFDYGYSYVSMYKLNKYYLNDWAKEMDIFDKQFHLCTFSTPSLGLIFTNNIINLSASFSKSRLEGKGVPSIDFYEYDTYLFVDLWSINVSYRRMIKLNYFLLGLGSTISFGKGYADIAYESLHELNIKEKRLNEGFGGGGNLFGEIDYILLKHIIIGIKLSGNVFFTETLKTELGKWVVDANGKEINLNYSGFSALVKIGFLW